MTIEEDRAEIRRLLGGSDVAPDPARLIEALAEVEAVRFRPPRTGLKHSAETRKQMSESQKGKKHPHTAESKAKISAGVRAFYARPEGPVLRAHYSATRRGSDNGNFGRPHTFEEREKISAAAKSRGRRARGEEPF